MARISICFTLIAAATVRLSDWRRRLSDENSTLCSPGCTLWFLQDKHCHEECDTLECDYGNWACRCSRDCPPALQNNDKCDLVCNTTECSYDKARCLPQPDVPTTLPVAQEQKTEGGSVFEAWKVSLIVVCGVICCGGMLLLCATMVVKALLLRKQRVAQESVGEASRALASMQQLRFSPELVDYGSATCTICLGSLHIEEAVVKTRCRHVFHFQCLSTWLTSNMHCPMYFPLSCMRHPFDLSAGEEAGERVPVLTTSRLEEVKEEGCQRRREDGSRESVQSLLVTESNRES